MKRGNGLADDSLDKKIINDDENINLIDVIGSDYDLEYDTINNILTKDILSFIENNNDRQAVRQNMLTDDSRSRCSDTFCSKHIFILLNGKNLPTNQPGHSHPVQETKYNKKCDHIDTKLCQNRSGDDRCQCLI